MAKPSPDQLARYAEVICLSQAGKSYPDIEKLTGIPEWMAMTFVANFCQIQAEAAA